MRRYAYFLTLASLVLAWVMLEAAAQRGATPPAVGSMPSRRFEKIAEGVFYATSTGSMGVGSNAVVIVNDDDALLIDPGETPAAARAFVEDIKSITDKPVRVVVDSHYHFDHAHGNQIFGRDVMLIGHDRTYDMLAGNPLTQRTYGTFATPELLQANMDAAKARLAATPAADAPARATLERQIALLAERIPQEREIVPTPPTTTFSSVMTLHRGTREIRLYYFGRGHTDTDVVVLLPKERIVATGDLMESQISYAGDAWMNEWPASLDKLAGLDFDTVLPGHGVPFNGKDKIRSFQAYLADFQKQVIALRGQGVSVEDAAKRVDLTSHAADWPQARNPGADVRAVQRIYDIAANPNAAVR